MALRYKVCGKNCSTTPLQTLQQFIHKFGLPHNAFGLNAANHAVCCMLVLTIAT
jgi:hypothetical protein